MIPYSNWITSPEQMISANVSEIKLTSQLYFDDDTIGHPREDIRYYISKKGLIERIEDQSVKRYRLNPNAIEITRIKHGSNDEVKWFKKIYLDTITGKKNVLKPNINRSNDRTFLKPLTYTEFGEASFRPKPVQFSNDSNACNWKLTLNSDTLKIYMLTDCQTKGQVSKVVRFDHKNRMVQECHYAAIEDRQETIYIADYSYLDEDELIISWYRTQSDCAMIAAPIDQKKDGWVKNYIIPECSLMEYSEWEQGEYDVVTTNSESNLIQMVESFRFGKLNKKYLFEYSYR